MAVRRLSDPLSAVFPLLLPGRGLVLSPSWNPLSHTVIHTACSHWTNFLKSLLLLSHSNSLSLHFLIGKMDMFMFSLPSYPLL